jgi:hypothetical protein
VVSVTVGETEDRHPASAVSLPVFKDFEQVGLHILSPVIISRIFRALLDVEQNVC